MASKRVQCASLDYLGNAGNVCTLCHCPFAAGACHRALQPTKLAVPLHGPCMLLLQI